MYSKDIVHPTFAPAKVNNFSSSCGGGLVLCEMYILPAG